MDDERYDVLISGAGPVGLVLAFHLKRLGHSVHIIDAVDKGRPDHAVYGRAAMLYPRTLEIFDQLDLYDDISQVGFASDRTWGYKDGEHIDRKWAVFDAPESLMDSTYFNTQISIRLKYSEDVFRRRLEELGVPVHAPAKLTDFKLDPEATDGHPVTATCTESDDATGASFQVKCRYIIGCDGGGSTVRRLAGIPFVGERKAEYWVRIDGIVKTNIPEARYGLGAFESAAHGHIVYLCLDHGATRIGYVLSDELFKKYGTTMTAEEAALEAKKAVAPFELEFLQIDWHTVYGIQQHVADRFLERERILIAGDAAHTHSSGSAQGMNTGMQDVTNLSWRLSGALKGWHRPEVLQDYSDERRAVALQLIENDKTISTLVAGRKPEHLQDRPEHAHVLLDEVLRKCSGFSTGLAVAYAPSALNDAASSAPVASTSPGQRLRDVLLQRSGLAIPKVRFYEVTKNNGKFRVIVLTGASGEEESVRLQALRKQVDICAPGIAHAVDFLTIIPGLWHAFDERLTTRRFGMAYWDPDLSAHEAWGVSPDEGAILVLRPDGILGHASPLANFDPVMRYLGRIFKLD